MRGFLNSLAAIAVAVTSISCGRDDHHEVSSITIVGGSLVRANHEIAKSTVALIDLSNNRAFCSGTLISQRSVLTAAHCLEGIDPSFKVGVSFGVNVATASSIPVQSIAQHPEYSPAMMSMLNPMQAPNDIALLTLAKAAPISYKPINPLVATDELVIGEPLILAGYGLTAASPRATTGLLRQVTTEITFLSKSRKELEFGNHPGRSACMGDSGGPAYVLRGGAIKLVGVTSRGSSRCDNRGIYTDARHFSEFIANHRI